MSYCENLTRIACEKKLSAKDLAARSGCGEARLDSYMRGDSVPSPSRLSALADALDVPPSAITGDACEPDSRVYRTYRLVMTVLAVVSFLPIAVYIAMLAAADAVYRQMITADGSLYGRADIIVRDAALYLAIGLMSFLLALAIAVFLVFYGRDKSGYMRYLYYRVFWVVNLVVLLNCCYIPSYANFFGFSLLHPLGVLFSYLFAFVGATALAAVVDALAILFNRKIFAAKTRKAVADIIFAFIGLSLIFGFIMYCTQAHALEWIALIMPLALFLLVPAAVMFLVLRIVME